LSLFCILCIFTLRLSIERRRIRLKDEQPTRFIFICTSLATSTGNAAVGTVRLRQLH